MPTPLLDIIVTAAAGAAVGWFIWALCSLPVGGPL